MQLKVPGIPIGAGIEGGGQTQTRTELGTVQNMISSGMLKTIESATSEADKMGLKGEDKTAHVMGQVRSFDKEVFRAIEKTEKDYKPVEEATKKVGEALSKGWGVPPDIDKSP